MSAAARVALITGGSRGIGATTAVTMAERGWDIAISYRERADVAQDVADACRELGRRAIAVHADLASEADIVALFAAVDDHFGPLGALVNNAGIVSPSGRVADYTAARIERVLTVNVTGAFLCAREAVRRMSTDMSGSGGVIVNVSSMAAVRGGSGEYVDYAASKAAVDALTTGLGREVVGEGIRVVGVSPGVIATEIHEPGRLERVGPNLPMGRPGDPQEIANAIAWLASDEASYVTATTLQVAGGR